MCECGAHSGPASASQSLDELEFERGLWFAAQYGDLERALELLNKGFQVDRRDAAGYTSLHYAARNGHLDLCRLLLDKGADINATTCQGKATALHRAATVGKVAVVKYLLERNAKFDMKDADERTALHRAAIEGHVEICKCLIKVGPELKYEVDIHNKTPADYAKSADLSTLLT